MSSPNTAFKDVPAAYRNRSTGVISQANVDCVTNYVNSTGDLIARQPRYKKECSQALEQARLIALDDRYFKDYLTELAKDPKNKKVIAAAIAEKYKTDRDRFRQDLGLFRGAFSDTDTIIWDNPQLIPPAFASFPDAAKQFLTNGYDERKRATLETYGGNVKRLTDQVLEKIAAAVVAKKLADVDVSKLETDIGRYIVAKAKLEKSTWDQPYQPDFLDVDEPPTTFIKDAIKIRVLLTSQPSKPLVENLGDKDLKFLYEHSSMVAGMYPNEGVVNAVSADVITEYQRRFQVQDKRK